MVGWLPGVVGWLPGVVGWLPGVVGWPPGVVGWLPGVVRWRPGRRTAVPVATTVMPIAHQNACWNAATGSAPAAAPARTTASTAVPNAPPSCCASRVMVLACGISVRSRPTNPTAITGIITAPSPSPRITRTSPIHHAFVDPSAKAKGIVARSTTAKPTIATHRAPMRSVSRPASDRLSREPTPWGMSSSPAPRASVPRSSWNDSGSRSIPP